jgi:hypothetical protein
VTFPATWSSGPSAGLQRAATSVASAATSPSAVAISVKPTSRAAAAVATPTAKTGRSRRWLRRTKARTPLAEVKSSPRTSSSGSAAPRSGEIVSSGSTSGTCPRAASRPASSCASSSGRVTSRRMSVVS